MKELSRGSFLPESILKKSSRFVTRKVIPFAATASLIFASCGGEKNNTQELKNNESSGYSLPFPEGETWFLTTGPHADGYSNGIKYAIDIAPPELGRLNGNCPTDGSRLSIGNRVVTASASGEVIAKGDDKNRNDLHHSEIRIKDKNGLTQVYIHLDKTKVKLGNKVSQGDPLGNPSCEYPPGGANTGPHVHVGLMKDGQAIPIDGVEIGGWTIHNGVDDKDGTMTKDGEKTRTADVGRFGENSTGIRNDLPNKSNKAVVAGPKDPIPQISGQINEKPVSPTATSERPIKEGALRFKSPNYPYEIDYPSKWTVKTFDNNILTNRPGKMDVFWGEKEQGFQKYIAVFSEPIDSKLTVDDYATQVFKQINDTRAKFNGLPQTVFSTEVGHWKGYWGDIGKDPQILLNRIPSTMTPSIGPHDVRIVVFTTKTNEGSRGWQLIFSTPDMSTTPKEFFTAFESFKLAVSKPTETLKPAVEKKISLSKKPEELYRALLTSPISPNVLPQGMSSGGISAAEIDATGKALKQVGAVTIAIEDSVSQAVKGYPNGVTFYGIFSDSSTSKSASEIIGTNLQNGRTLKDFPYPAKVYTTESFFGVVIKTLVMSVENVTVAVSITGTDTDILESRVILLTQAAIEHLGKVGK